MKRVMLLLMLSLLLACNGGNGGALPATNGTTTEWQPPQTPGLHLILDIPDKREYFSVLRIPEGLLLGDYGLYDGGPDIQFFDGTLKTEQTFPNRESIFDLFMPDDGFPLATAEHYASIYKYTNGKWELKYSRPREYDLMFYVRKAGNTLYANWNSYDIPVSGLVQSIDNGNTWKDIARYQGINLYGMGSDGANIFLAGSKGVHLSRQEYPVMVDINGSVLASRPSLKSYSYWGVIYNDNLWNMGSFQDYNISGRSGFIDAFNGVTLTRVFTTDRPHIHAMQIYDGKRYAVATWGWSALSNKTSLLLASSDGYNWSVLTEIPCPHIIGMSFADGGVYLVGGEHRKRGMLFFNRL